MAFSPRPFQQERHHNKNNVAEKNNEETRMEIWSGAKNRPPQSPVRLDVYLVGSPLHVGQRQMVAPRGGGPGLLYSPPNSHVTAHPFTRWEPRAREARIGRSFADEFVNPSPPPRRQRLDVLVRHDLLNRGAVPVADANCMPLESLKLLFLEFTQQRVVNWGAVLDH